MIAESTGHRVSEVRTWPADEVFGWAGFYKWRAKQEKEAMEKAKQDAKSKRRR